MTNLKKRLDELMQSEIDQNNAVGTELFVFHYGSLIYEGSFGSDVPGGTKKLDENSIFRMFSMTKPVTAVAAAIAMSRGLFTRESKISEFLPAFKNVRVLAEEERTGKNDLSALLVDDEKKTGESKTDENNSAGMTGPDDNPSGERYDEKCGKPESTDKNSNNNVKIMYGVKTVPADREITVGDCLGMTAGLEYPNDQTKAGMILGKELFWPLEAGYPDRKMSTVELMNRVADYPLLYQPGTRWNYSLCADVIGAVIEVASGMRYGDFLKEYIFDPLGMEDTDFYVPAEKLDRLVPMHDKQGDEWVKWEGTFLGMEKKDYGDPALQKRPAFESGGAGLVSTPKDYTNFLMMLLNEGRLEPGYAFPCYDMISDEREPSGYVDNMKPSLCLIEKEEYDELIAPALNEEQKKTADWYSLKGYNYGTLMRVLEDPDDAETSCVPVGEFGWDGWAGTYFSIDPENKILLLYFVNQTNGNREWHMKALKRVIYDELGKAGELK